MASTYSTNLKLELIGTGEQSGVWGTTTNTNMGTAIEQAIVGKGSPVFSTDADLTLTLSNSSAAQTARAFVLNVTSGVSLTTTRNLVVPTIEKPYVVMNNTTGGQSIVVKTAAGSGITVPNGGQVFLYVDGTNVIQMLDAFGDLTYTGTLTGGTGTVNLGSGQFVKDASGNVGLNTTPSYLFDARSASSIVARLQSTTSGAHLSFLDNGGINGYVRIGASNNDLVLMSGNNINGTLNAAGNLGLGVAPSASWNASNRAFQIGPSTSLFNPNSGSISVFATNAVFTAAGTASPIYQNTAAAAYYAHSSGAHQWFTAPSGTAGNAISFTQAMTLDASGKLSNSASSSNVASFNGTGGSGGYVTFENSAVVYGDIGTANQVVGGSVSDFGINARGARNLIFGTNNAERVRIDTSGNMGVSVTPSTWNASIKALSVGRAGSSVYSFTGSNIVGLTCNASYIASDWTYVSTDAATRYQQNAGLHTWYTAPSGTAGNPISFTEAMALDASGNLTPGGDNTQTNGSGAKRWSVIYAGTGTINTSDAREKTDVRVMAADEIEAAKALSKEIGVYQFLDSVAAKGDKARHHIGMTVQRAIEIMKHHGLDPFSYGFICYDKWGEETKEHPAVEAREAVEAKDAVLDDEGNVIEPAVEAQPAIKAKDAWTEVTQQAGDRYSFRYDQLTLFIARGIDARLVALESA